MTNINRLIGTRFETELCEVLSKHGWWAHNLTQNHAGQPADVIAVKNGTAVLIDCKDCKNDRFPLSRIEPNQETAMGLWLFRGNKYAYFVLRTSKGIFFIPYSDLVSAELSGIKTLNLDQISKYHTLNKWLQEMG